MTYTDDFVPIDSPAEEPEYPVAFGIVLTPKVQGIALAILGIAGAGYLFYQFVLPYQAQKADLEQQIAEKEAQLRSQEETIARIEAIEAELDAALQQRAGIYGLLGDARSLDTLLLDINQQIEASNASIEQVVASDFNRDAATLASLGFTPTQVARLRTQFANDPVIQKVLYTSKLFTFNPSGLSGPITDGTYGPELDGKLARQVVTVRFQALFNQTQTILRNIERLEPLLIIRDMSQQIAAPPGDLSEEDLLGLTRLLDTSFTLEVLVPIVDPLEPPVPLPPEPVEGAEGEGPADGTAPPAEEVPVE
ncbi:MAG: hypothetical protein IGR92_00210 [Leptolyngbyaceae cyanobacterium T60_A2020_046]|nr:hypothetical protein [Leptolyngbyaceae cyanobacterium T60_A2020_046]